MKNKNYLLLLVYIFIFQSSIVRGNPLSKVFHPINKTCTAPDSAGLINGKDNVCYKVVETYSVATIAFATGYKWTLPSGASIVSGANTNTITVIFYGGSGYITVEGTNSCSTGKASRFFVTLNPLPKLTLISPQKYCCDYGNIALGSSTFASPVGGNWTCRQSSSLINGNTFLTSLACNPMKQEIFSMYYAYQDPVTSCINKDSTYFIINPLPALKFEGGSICQNFNKVRLKPYIKAPINLNSMNDVKFKLLRSLPKIGGGFCTVNDLITDEDASLNIDFWLTFSKMVIDLGTKSKDSLIIEITVQDASGCYNKDTASFMIINVPEISFGSFPQLCINTGKVDLKLLSNVKPLYGCWSVIDTVGFNSKYFILPGMIGCDSLDTKKLNLQNGTGLYRLRYTTVTNGCFVKRDTNLRLNALPNVKISLSPSGDKGKFCEGDEDVTLNSSPIGGSWSSSVTGIISGGKFEPSAVSPTDRDKWITLTYSYTHPQTQCDTAKSISVFVQSKPRVSAITSDIDTCYSNFMQFKLEANYSFASKISWVHNQNAAKSSFENNQQLSNLNPTIFNIYPRSDTTTNVFLTVYTESEGVCSFAMDTIKLIIHPIPKASVIIDDATGCEPHSVQFLLQNIKNADSTLSEFLWTFGEPNDVTSQNATHTFSKADSFNVNLKITSEFGCKNSIGPLPITVYPLPVADFNTSPNNRAMVSMPRFKFIDKSKTSEHLFGSKIVKYIWDFGNINTDKDTSFIKNTEYDYPSDTGTYFITLLVETNHGCRDTIIKSVVIVPDAPFQYLIYPNPNKGIFNIEINKQGIYTFRLYSSVGKLVLQKMLMGYERNTIIQKLGKGNYVVSISDSSGNVINQKMTID